MGGGGEEGYSREEAFFRCLKGSRFNLEHIPFMMGWFVALSTSVLVHGWCHISLLLCYFPSSLKTQILAIFGALPS